MFLLKIQAAKRDAMSLLLDHEFIIQVSDTNERSAGDNISSCDWGSRKKRCMSCNETRYVASPLGRATTLSGLPPADAVTVLESLQKARKRLVLKSGFHSIFLSTPPSTSIEPNWSIFEPLLANLQKEYPVNFLIPI